MEPYGGLDSKDKAVAFPLYDAGQFTAAGASEPRTESDSYSLRRVLVARIYICSECMRKVPQVDGANSCLIYSLRQNTCQCDVNTVCSYALVSKEAVGFLPHTFSRTLLSDKQPQNELLASRISDRGDDNSKYRADALLLS